MILEEKSREELIRELKNAQEELTRMRWSIGTRELQTTSSVFPGMVSERRYRSLFENSPVPIWEEDFSPVRDYLVALQKSGVQDFRKFFTENRDQVIQCINLVKVLDVNEATINLYRSNSKEDFLQGLRRVLPDESLDVMREEFITLAEGKTTFEAEIVQRLFTGEKIEALLRLVIAPGHEYDWSRTLVSIVDISDRKRAELDLRKSRERFELAAAGANDGLWDWDLVTNEMYFSPRWKDMLGYRDEEFPNQFAAFQKAIHPADRDRVITTIRDYLKGKQPIFETEFRLRHKKGSYRWILARAAAIWNEQGRPVRMAGSHMDITERVEAQVQLERRARELETVTEVSNAVSTFLDVDSMLQRVVDLTKERFGLYHAHIYLVDEDGENLVLKAGAGEIGKQMAAEHSAVPLSALQSVVARAANLREGVRVNNVKMTTHYLPHPLLPNTYSEVAVPLVVGNTLIGVLDVQSDQADYFSDEDVKIQTILASQIAVAIQNARQYAEVQESKEKLAEALKISEMCNWEIDFGRQLIKTNDQFYTLHRTSAETMKGYKLSIHNYVQTFVHPEDRREVLLRLREEALSTAPGAVTEFSCRIVDAKGKEHWVAQRVRGIVDVDGKLVGAYGVTHDLTELERAKNLLELQANQLATVSQVSTIISTIQNPEEMLQAVVDQTKEKFGLYHSHIYLLDESGENLVLAASSGEIGRKLVAEGQVIAVDAEGSIVARAFRTRQGMISEDTSHGPNFGVHPLLPDVHSELAIPMIVGDQRLGVLNVQGEYVGRFETQDIQIYTPLASQVAVALQNARLYAQAQREAEQEALINTISERIQATTTVESALKVAVQELGRALGASQTTVRLQLSDENHEQEHVDQEHPVRKDISDPSLGVEK